MRTSAWLTCTHSPLPLSNGQLERPENSGVGENGSRRKLKARRRKKPGKCSKTEIVEKRSEEKTQGNGRVGHPTILMLKTKEIKE